MDFAAKITKQIINIQRTYLNNVFETQALLQDQTQRAAQAILDQNEWIPDAGRQLWNSWTTDLESGQSTFKSMLNAHFDMVDGILTHQDTQT